MNYPVYAAKGRRVTIPSSLGLPAANGRTIVTDDPETAVTLPDTILAQRFRRRALARGDLVEIRPESVKKARRAGKEESR